MLCLYLYSPEIAKRLHRLPSKSDAEGQREVERVSYWLTNIHSDEFVIRLLR